MREKPLVDHVDVVVGAEGDERLVTVAKPIADRWPDIYRPATTSSGRPTAAAKRAVTADTNVPETPSAGGTKRTRKPASKKAGKPATSDELPSAPDPTPAPAGVDTAAGASGVTTEGVTS